MGRHSVGRYLLLCIFVVFFGSYAAVASASIVTVQAVSTSNNTSQENVPVTFGQIFRPGDVPVGAHLQATLGGKPIPIQVDRKATNADDSLRHAVITVVVPKLPASAKRLITLSTGGDTAKGNPVTLDDLLATSFDATVSLDVGGKTFTASARDLLEKARAHQSCQPWGKQCNLWLSGPQVSEWIVGESLQSASGASPHLAARFYVRAYAGDPINSVRVNIVIENDWTWASDPHNITYDATLIAGSQSYEHDDIEHYTHTRWHHVLWWHKEIKVYAKLDGEYIQASKAVSQYADVHPTDKFLDGVIQSVPPMGRGNQTPDMRATGAQHGIGPLPQWTTAYLLSMDQRAFRWMLANDDAAGSYNVFFRDQHTGRPVSLLDHPRMTRKGSRSDAKDDAFPKCGGECDDPNNPNWAHQPSVGYLSYMVTGDFYYLEQLQFWADWLIFSTNPYYRDFTKGLVKSGQVRGQAWDLRDLANAAYITPDTAPLKSYFVDMVNNNIAWYNQHYTDNPDANKLGAITNGYAIIYDNHGHHSGPDVRLAPWQDDFFTWMVGHLVDLGFGGAEKLLEWKAQFPVGRMISPFCYVLGSSYTLKVRDGEKSSVYGSFEQVYDASFSPEVRELTCGSTAMAQHLGERYKVGDMYGFPWSEVGYPANMQPALAAAVDAGVSAKAPEAWNKFINQPTRPDYSDYANFAIVPRTDQKTPPGGDGPLAPRIDFYADPNPVRVGGSTTLHWAAVGATACTGDWMDGKAISGEKHIGPVNGVHAYTIECTGAGGSSTAVVKVADVTQRKPIINIKASPTTVQAGQNTVITWSTQYANWCTVSGGDWSGDILLQGQKTVGPLTQDTRFEVACRGALGDTDKRVLVQVEALATQTTEDKPASSSKGGGGVLSVFGLLWLLGGIAAIRRRKGDSATR